MAERAPVAALRTFGSAPPFHLSALLRAHDAILPGGSALLDTRHDEMAHELGTVFVAQAVEARKAGERW